ncbi:MAG: hypothetical protein E4G96_10755, partial [Chrysiogenales bacterium]
MLLFSIKITRAKYGFNLSLAPPLKISRKKTKIYLPLPRHCVSLTKIVATIPLDMKSLKTLIITTVICGFLMGSDTTLLSWGLFNLFTDSEFSAEGLEKAEAFDPNRDILYLPQIGGRDIFESTRDFSICRNREVRRHIYLYLTSKRPYLVRAIERSYLYEDAIREVFRENSDLPADLLLLPLLESCFDPYAVSTSRAVGLWQIMSNTAGPLGLRANRWIDERRNVEKSTLAAVRHLRAMHSVFG